jgi:hypothetical protein
VVEYALSRSLSPALIAEYQTLPDKKLLRSKLHEFHLQNAAEEVSERPRQDLTFQGWGKLRGVETRKVYEQWNEGFGENRRHARD